MSFPVKESAVFHTEAGTPYLKEPGVAMISKPEFQNSLHEFLDGFDKDLGFITYPLDGSIFGHEDGKLPSGTHLCKVAGQLCYMSFGPNRTKNKDAERYFKNIISSGHGSVLEHANYSFLLYGVSRSLTHELVRHRAGMAYSQVSQRYVGGSKLRFVERPEFQNNEVLHEWFEERIDDFVDQYETLAQELKEANDYSDMHPTDARKKVNQVARAILPNETEAPVIVTGNVRSWRHILEMRGSPHAETEVRNLAIKLYDCLVEVEPILFMDFEKQVINDEECLIRKEL